MRRASRHCQQCATPSGLQAHSVGDAQQGAKSVQDLQLLYRGWLLCWLVLSLFCEVMLLRCVRCLLCLSVLSLCVQDETDFLIKNALSITADQYRLKRSSTGTNGYTVDTYRTSENAFDTSSEVIVIGYHEFLI